MAGILLTESVGLILLWRE